MNQIHEHHLFLVIFIYIYTCITWKSKKIKILATPNSWLIQIHQKDGLWWKTYCLMVKNSHSQPPGSCFWNLGKLMGISTTNLPQLFVRSPDLEKFPGGRGPWNQGFIHWQERSATHGGMGRPGIFGGWEFSTGWCGMDFFWCPAIFFWNVFSIRSDISKDWKVEDFFHICWVFVDWSMIDNNSSWFNFQIITWL